ncbi:MAG TPA: hypothetical protein VGL04_13345 [Sporichthyaceae bacterium]
MHLRGKVAALHVGAHKTGTTVLQKYLSAHEAELRAKGVYYLRRSQLARYAGWGERLVEDPAPLAARLRKFRADPRFRVLIGSNENLMGRPFPKRGDGQLYPQAARNTAALRKALRGTGCKIVLSVRPQPDFLESYYLQTVHQGRDEPFEEWLARVDLTALSWRPMVTSLQEAFGPKRVVVVDFRLIKAGQEAYLRHLLSRVDPHWDHDVHFTESRNRSISERGLQMALAANQHLASGAERAALRGFLQTHFSNVDFPRPVLLGEDRRAALWEHYREDYEDLVGGA